MLKNFKITLAKKRKKKKKEKFIRNTACSINQSDYDFDIKRSARHSALDRFQAIGPAGAGVFLSPNISKKTAALRFSTSLFSFLFSFFKSIFMILLFFMFFFFFLDHFWSCSQGQSRALVPPIHIKSFRAVSEQFQSNFSKLSEQFQSNYRAISEQFQGNLRAILEQFLSNFRAISEQFQSNLRAVLEQFFKAISEQF